ncbi:hypothetical protein GCM10027418_29270 [Mariniluteicoccus endophyticus]
MSDSGFQHMRISDAERTQALDALSGHYVEGRIDLSELDERSGAITSARTLGEIAPLFGDLPGGLPFVAGPDGQPQPREWPVVDTTRDEAERDLARVARKGKLVEKFDTVGGGVALVLFFALMFLFKVGNAWLVWPVFGVLAVVTRFAVGFTQSEEDAYGELKKAEADERAERVRIALERRREIEPPRDDPR